jgi:hypothetical protein
MDYIVELSSKGVAFSTGAKIPIISRKYMELRKLYMDYSCRLLKGEIFCLVLLVVLVILRFFQTGAYISLFFISLIRLKEPKRKRVTLTVAIYIAVAAAYCAFFV